MITLFSGYTFLSAYAILRSMQARDIEKYLSQLGEELVNRGVHHPIGVLMIGGAYMMLLANAPRNTEDIDIFWLEDEETLQQALRALRDGVHTVAEKNALRPNWLNYLTQLLGVLKKSFAKLISNVLCTPTCSQNNLSQSRRKQIQTPKQSESSTKEKPKREKKRLLLGKDAVTSPVF